MSKHGKDEDSWDGMLAGGILLVLILVGVIACGVIFFRAVAQ